MNFYDLEEEMRSSAFFFYNFNFQNYFSSTHTQILCVCVSKVYFLKSQNKYLFLKLKYLEL